MHTAHYRLIVIFRDPSRKLDFAILHDRISTPGIGSTESDDEPHYRFLERQEQEKSSPDQSRLSACRLHSR
jgi:hypothetical protein